MSVASLSAPPPWRVCARTFPGKPERNSPANEVSEYRASMSQEDAVRKSLFPISLNVRTQIWMSRDLKIFSNSEYAYAIFPVAIALV